MSLDDLAPDDCPLCGETMRGESTAMIGTVRKTEAHLGCASDWFADLAEAREEASL